MLRQPHVAMPVADEPLRIAVADGVHGRLARRRVHPHHLAEMQRRILRGRRRPPDADILAMMADGDEQVPGAIGQHAAARLVAPIRTHQARLGVEDDPPTRHHLHPAGRDRQGRGGEPHHGAAAIEEVVGREQLMRTIRPLPDQDVQHTEVGHLAPDRKEPRFVHGHTALEVVHGLVVGDGGEAPAWSRHQQLVADALDRATGVGERFEADGGDFQFMEMGAKKHPGAGLEREVVITDGFAGARHGEPPGPQLAGLVVLAGVDGIDGVLRQIDGDLAHAIDQAAEIGVHTEVQVVEGIPLPVRGQHAHIQRRDVEEEIRLKVRRHAGLPDVGEPAIPPEDVEVRLDLGRVPEPGPGIWNVLQPLPSPHRRRNGGATERKGHHGREQPTHHPRHIFPHPTETGAHGASASKAPAPRPRSGIAAAAPRHGST